MQLPFLFFSLFFSLTLITSCTGQEKAKPNSDALNLDFLDFSDAELGDYIVELFEDSKGNLWIGTLSKGVARYDGQSLRYFTKEDGLCGNAVIQILEDKMGNLWFASRGGISKYDSKSFTNFTKKDGLSNDQVSHIFIDSKDTFWVGTWGGVFRFDGERFSEFPLPNPNIEIPAYQATANWVSDIIEDRQGNIWIARSGKAVCKYNPKKEEFSYLTKVDGLPSNCVQEIQEGKDGNLWFGCRIVEKDHPDVEKRVGEGGLCRYDGRTFTSFPNYDGLSKNDVYEIYEDTEKNLWIGANGVGLYRYDGKEFSLFDKKENGVGGLMSILKDSHGTLWVGCAGGLYRLFDSTLVNVRQNGPWKPYNNYRSGKKIGLWKVFYENGALKNEGNYESGKLEGCYRTWQKDGKLASEGFYREDLPNGWMRWYHEKGHLAAEGNMKNGKRNGSWTICDIEPGTACIDAYFRNEVREGTWKFYHNNGKLRKEQIWKNNHVVSEQCWDTMGTAITCKDL